MSRVKPARLSATYLQMRQPASLPLSPPPDGHDFLRGACVALIRDDHLVFCGDGLKPEALRYFLHQIAEKRSRPQNETQYDFAPVANKEVLKKVQSEGVKSIGIDATLDEFEPGGQLFETLGGTLKNDILNALRSLWEKDPKFASLHHEDFHNVNAKVVLTLDKRHAKGVSQEAFDDVAQRTIDSQEPGFYLRTRDNALISYHTVSLSPNRRGLKVAALPSAMTA